MLGGERAQDVVALEPLARVVQRTCAAVPFRFGQADRAAVEKRQIGERDGVARAP